MAYGEYLAHIFEYSSRHSANAPADPRMIRYGSSIYPEDVGADLVIMDIEDFRQAAELAEPRLRAELLRLVQTIDYGMAAKSSEGGKRLYEFVRDKQMQEARMQYIQQMQGNPEPIDQGNYRARAPDNSGYY